MSTTPAPAAPATDAPLPPAPNPTLTDDAPIPTAESVIRDALAEAGRSPLQGGSDRADLDALIAESAQPAGAPFSLTLTADPGAVVGALVLVTALVGITAAVAIAYRRVTSPEARERLAKPTVLVDERAFMDGIADHSPEAIRAKRRLEAECLAAAHLAKPTALEDEREDDDR